jgi:hypothetical protein
VIELVSNQDRLNGKQTLEAKSDCEGSDDKSITWRSSVLILEGKWDGSRIPILGTVAPDEDEPRRNQLELKQLKLLKSFVF